MGHPRLKPRKGWRFRVIVCTPNGYALDDCMDPEAVPRIAANLISCILYCEKPKGKGA